MPRTGINLEQPSADQYAVEYCHSPTPDAEERISILLDLLLVLLVAASASLPEMPPALAIVGNPETWWSAGTGAPQWIEIDLGRETDIRQIRLTPSQYPNGQTVHSVLGRGESGSLVLLHAFDGPTADLQAPSYAPSEPWRGLRYIRI